MDNEIKINKKPDVLPLKKDQPSPEEGKEISKDSKKSDPDESKSTFGHRAKKRAIKSGLGCGCLVLFVVGLMAVGAYLWTYSYPKGLDWLEDHGVKIDALDQKDSEGTVEYRTEENTVIKITNEENTIISVVDDNMESVVSIALSQVQFSPGEGVIDSSSPIGTGFIVDKNGLIMTNEHVVSDRDADYTVVTNEGEEFLVEEIVHDDINDIAILKIDAEGLNPVNLGDSDNLVQGQIVIAIGTPLGEFAGSVTTGVVSGLNRSVTTNSGSFIGSAKTFENVIQTDAAINPGNSGGPLLNSAGEVVGINFATTDGADNISFALPINFAKQRLEEYITYGKFLKPYIGIEYEIIDPATAQYYEDVVPGAFVRRVIDGSPAETAGIKRGDIVTKINDEDVVSSFAALIQKNKIGDKISLQLFRDGEILTVEVTLAEAE